MKRAVCVTFVVCSLAITAAWATGATGSRAPARTSAAKAFAGLFSVLRPTHVITSDGRRGNGNLHVRGPVWINLPSPVDLCYAYQVVGIPTPTSARVHRGRAGRTGPAVATLGVTENGKTDVRSGCVDISRELLRDIRRHPERYYVEVTGKYYSYPPGGRVGADRVRGQLFSATGTQDP